MPPATTQRGIRLRAQQVFRFNVMVVGESGLGKSTFLRTLFKLFTSFDDVRQLVPEHSDAATEAEPLVHESSLDDDRAKTTQVRQIGRLEREIGDTRYIFTVIDTPGYGDYIDNNKSFEPIEEFIDGCYKSYRALQISLDSILAEALGGPDGF